MTCDSLSTPLFPLTSCNFCHITYGVNTANGVGVSRVYVAVEDKGCKKKHNLICVIIKYWSRLRITGWCNPNFTESGSKYVCLVAHCAGWWACGWRCGWCRSGPGSTGCCGLLQSHTGHRNLCTQSLPEPWWGPPHCAGFWWTLRPPQTWGWWAEDGNSKNKGGQEGQVHKVSSELMYVLNSRLKDSLVIWVLVQKVQDLH